jgi:LysR family cys regulon transcriptional activator
MNLKQLKVVREIVRQRFHVTDAADALCTSQSGVSKQIKDLEDELGIQLFTRNGKRLTGLTKPGEEVVGQLDRVLKDVDGIRRLAANFAASNHGVLTVATTHTQARYMLPPILKKFRQLYPKVELVLLQANPKDIGELLLSGRADVGTATETMEDVSNLLTFPFYSWEHVVIAPKRHALLDLPHVTLHDIAANPIVTYHEGLTGRGHIDEAFADAGIRPNITMAALDADVIKTYVELGFGIGIIAPMAFDPARDAGLARVSAANLFTKSRTSIAVQRGAFLRDFTYRFIELCVPELTEKIVREANVAV